MAGLVSWPSLAYCRLLLPTPTSSVVQNARQAAGAGSDVAPGLLVEGKDGNGSGWKFFGEFLVEGFGSRAGERVRQIMHAGIVPDDEQRTMVQYQRL